MANDVTEYGRKKVTWPDLASDPGQTLHDQVTGSVANISNQLSKHWSGDVSIAAGQTDIPDIIVIKGDYFYYDDGTADSTYWDVWQGTYVKGGDNSVTPNSEYMYYDLDTDTVYAGTDDIPQDFGNGASISAPPVWFYAPRYYDDPEQYGYGPDNQNGWNIIVYFWWSFTNEGDPNFDNPPYGAEGWYQAYTNDDPTDNTSFITNLNADYPENGESPFYCKSEITRNGQAYPNLNNMDNNYNGIDYSRPFVTYGSNLTVENFVHNLDTPLSQLRYYVKKDGAFLTKNATDAYFDIQEVDSNTISLAPKDGNSCTVQLYVEPNMYVEPAHFPTYFFYEVKDAIMNFTDDFDDGTPLFDINSMKITFRRINNIVFWSTTSTFYMKAVTNTWNYAECNLTTNYIDANSNTLFPDELKTTLNAQEGVCGFANLRGYIFSFRMEPGAFKIYVQQTGTDNSTPSDQTGWSGLSGHYMID